MKAYESTLDALGDPTRRAIVDLLRQGPASVSAIAAELPVSRPAVSQHLRVLERAALVDYSKEGTRRLYALRREGLESLRSWVDDFWSDALERFAAAAEHRSTLDALPTDPRPQTSPDDGEERP